MQASNPTVTNPQADTDLDALFGQLIKESQDFAAERKREKAAKRKPVVLPSGQRASDRMEELKKKRLADLAFLREGLLPGGWELEGLTMQVTKCTCEHCGSVTEAMSPPVVYQVMRQSRHKETKFLRPLRSGEFSYHETVAHTSLHVERTEVVVPVCHLCVQST